MTDEKKQEFTLRISRANRTEMTVIIYEIAQEYVREAIDVLDGGFVEGQTQVSELERYNRAVRNAGMCIDTLKSTLDFTYPLSGTLLHLYISMKKQLARAIAGRNPKHLDIVLDGLKELADAFRKVAEADDSAPLYENSQDVTAGYTYGKSGVNVNPEMTGRGFLA
ncbi:MAG: flagellar protein FliS [Lachnospiraceae bacterium]|nr:flagellar protein FliS [Candidatus Merdinaster equi]